MGEQSLNTKTFANSRWRNHAKAACKTNHRVTCRVHTPMFYIGLHYTDVFSGLPEGCKSHIWVQR